MTRLLLAYDRSAAARAAVRVAAALFPGADSVVATVEPPSPTLGSVASGLVNAAAIPVIVVPGVA